MLGSLKTNIEKFIAAYENVKGENVALREQADKDRQEIITLKAQIIELNKQIDSLRLTAAFSGTPTQDTGAKEKVERLIREIDKCIALMEE
ncbi:MAG: hypothetical protein KBT05_06910 [Bacteroidales bacterium]|nr:hypothetical protein [Candidatus Cryptobacteroides caccocaballi]